MNVLIDLHWMKIGRSGGMEQLACELVTSISWLWDRGKITVYCPGEACEELKGSSRAAKIDFIDSNVYELVPSREPFARGELRRFKGRVFQPFGGSPGWNDQDESENYQSRSGSFDWRLRFS